jgi:hypothetical protein
MGQGKRNGRSGQSLIEYVLLVAIVVMLFSFVMKRLADGDAMARLKRPFTEEFKFTYRYGHPEARGHEDGGPVNIPQYQPAGNASGGDHNFRIFLNPSKK